LAAVEKKDNQQSNWPGWLVDCGAFNTEKVILHHEGSNINNIINT